MSVKKSMKKIDRVFDRMFENKISVKENSAMSRTTIDTYRNMVKSVFREVNQQHGVQKIWEVKDEHIEEVVSKRIEDYHLGNTSEAYNLGVFASALKSFNVGIEKTNVFKKHFSVGDPDEIRQVMKESNVQRKSSASKVLRATPDECISVLDNIQRKGYITETRKLAYSVGKIQLATGGRISAVLRLKVEDISVDEGRITFKKDKGGLTRSVEISPDTVTYLKELKEGKKQGQYIFGSKRSDGTYKSIKEVRKELSKIINEAGSHLTRSEKVKMKDADGEFKMVDVERKFSSHCFRKSFALQRTSEYYDKFSSKSEIDRFVEEKKEELATVDIDLSKKLKMAKDRVNQDRKTNRDLTREEYSIFFTSIDLGHFRNDVMTSFYTTFKEVENYRKEKV